MSNQFKQVGIVSCVVIALQFFASCAEAVTIAHWRFEPGNFLADSSGNGHTLTGTATQSFDVANASGGSGSALFNGTTNSLQTVSSLDLTSYDSLRISFAMRQSGSAAGVVLEHTANYNSNNGAFLVDVNEFPSGTGITGLKMGAPATAGYNIDNLPHFTSGTEWDIFQIDYNPTALDAADVVQIIRNGVPLADSTAYGLHGTTTSFSFLDSIMYIGARGGSSLFFNGNIDEILIEAPPFFVAPEPVPVPEPSSLLCLSLGLICLIRKVRSKE